MNKFIWTKRKNEHGDYILKTSLINKEEIEINHNNGIYYVLKSGEIIKSELNSRQDAINYVENNL